MSSVYLSTKKSFRTFILISFFIHITCFLIGFFLPQAFISKPLQIKQAVRVDMVGLPDIQKPKSIKKNKAKPKPKKVVQKQKKPPKKTPPPKKKVPQKNIKQTKTAQAQAIEKLKTQKDEPVYRGEKISKGTTQEGETDALLMYAYFVRVKAHVNIHWNLPQLLADKNFKATVLIQVNRRGEITRIELEKTSGNETFDQIVIDTIKMSSPLPEPPEELTSLLDQGVGFNFPE